MALALAEHGADLMLLDLNSADSEKTADDIRTSRAGSTPAVHINMGAGDAAKSQYTHTLPLPDNHRGIPIVATRRIASTQAIEA